VRNIGILLLFRKSIEHLLFFCSGFDWMAQFQQNFDLDLNNPAAYDQNMDYMTGPVNNH